MLFSHVRPNAFPVGEALIDVCQTADTSQSPIGAESGQTSFLTGRLEVLSTSVARRKESMPRLGRFANLLWSLPNLPFLLSCLILVPSASWAQVHLSPWAVPDRGVAGVTQINITGAGFPTGTIPPGDVAILIAHTCDGSGAVAAPASIVTTILGSTRRVEFQVPGVLTGVPMLCH